MQAPAERTICAWQPLTPGGIAAFAAASLSRLLLVQFLVALLAAASVVWFLDTAWFPVIGAAFNHLPEQGQLRYGQLEWAGEPVQSLAENRFLALAVDLRHEGTVRSPAYLDIEFGRSDCRMFSLLGFVECKYPSGWAVPFNRGQLIPWWGAWAPPLLAIAAAGVIVGLLLAWALLASFYFIGVWLIGFFADRLITLGGSWRLAGAALMPGALLMTAAVFAHTHGALNLVELGGLLGGHLVLGWIFVVISPFFLPRRPAQVPKGNPFAPASNPKVAATDPHPSSHA